VSQETILISNQTRGRTVTSVNRYILIKIFNEKIKFLISCLLRVLLTLIFLICYSCCSLQFVLLHRSEHAGVVFPAPKSRTGAISVHSVPSWKIIFPCVLLLRVSRSIFFLAIFFV
jgi:hypothetical protein